MKHASNSSLDALEELLVSLRSCAVLKEKARGVFYFRSRAFLHFHEDPVGLFADLRPDAAFERFPVNTGAERRTLLRKVREAVGDGRRRP